MHNLIQLNEYFENYVDFSLLLKRREIKVWTPVSQRSPMHVSIAPDTDSSVGKAWGLVGHWGKGVHIILPTIRGFQKCRVQTRGFIL